MEIIISLGIGILIIDFLIIQGDLNKIKSILKEINDKLNQKQ